MKDVKSITIERDGSTKHSKSNRTISEILNSIYAQYNVKASEIVSGIIDATSTTTVETSTNIKITIV